MRILLVDGDEILTNKLQKSLTQQNYTIDTVIDGKQGWIYTDTYTYDLIILDWDLQKINAIELCQKIRANGYNMPILLLTKVGHSSAEKNQALDVGADDCLCKPFSLEELNARIRALLRRFHCHPTSVLSWGNLQLNPCTCQVTYQQQPIALTNKEYQLLELFLRCRYQVFSIEDIIDNLWTSVEYPSTATVRSHLRHLRQKLKEIGLKEDPIETLRGRGYRLKSTAENWKNLSTQSSIKQSTTKPNEISIDDDHFEQTEQHQSQPQLSNLARSLTALKQGKLNHHQQHQAQLHAYQLAENLTSSGFSQASSLAQKFAHTFPEENHHSKEYVLKLEDIFTQLCCQLDTENNCSNSVSTELTLESPLILLIDDDLEFRRLFTQQAIGEELRVITVEHLESAQTWLSELAKNQLPHLVVIKIAFHGNDNQQVISQSLALISHLQAQTPSIPTVVIADRDQPSDRLLVAEKGATFYLKKPITPQEAIKFCHLALKRSSVDKKIMIVDDDEELLRDLPNLLQPWQFNITTLHDPRQFWDVLQVIEPDVIILEMEMPHGNGIDLCRVIHTHPDWYHLPILLWTEEKNEFAQEKALLSGASDFVFKPIQTRQLVDRILNCLPRK